MRNSLRSYLCLKIDETQYYIHPYKIVRFYSVYAHSRSLKNVSIGSGAFA